MNAEVEAGIMSREVFDPSSLDAAPRPPLIDTSLFCVEDLSLDPERADDVTVGGGPRFPWEPIP
jgi:hypothetical protein